MKKFVEYLEAVRPDFLPVKGMVMGRRTRNSKTTLGSGKEVDVTYKARTNANFSRPVDKTGRMSHFARIIQVVDDSRDSVEGSASRAKIAAVTKLDNSSLGRYLVDLVDLDILRKVDKGFYGPGKHFDEYIKYGKQVDAEIKAALANKAGGVKAKPKKFQD